MTEQASHADFPRLWMVGVLIVGTLILYARVARFDFINYDDPDYVYDNANLAHGLTPASIKWAFTTGERSNWHPLTWISYLIDIELFGGKPGWMHLENVLIHTCNAAILFWLLARATKNDGPSFWAAAMFAWHPLHIESVAWISERKDVLSTLFMMLSLSMYVGYVRKPAFWRYAIVAIFMALGLMAKPMIVTLPCVMLLLDFWPLNRPRRDIGKIVLEKVPLFALAAASSIITIHVQSAGASVASLQETPFLLRLLNAIVSYATYLRMTIAPYGLAIFYPHPATYPGGAIATSTIVISTIIFASLTVMTIAFARKSPWLTVGWLWFLGTLLPVIGLIQAGKQSMADRYTYVPLIGIFIAIAWSIRNFRTAGAAGAITLISASLLSWRQIGFWRNSETVMAHAVEVVPNNYIAYGSLGQALESTGNRAGAENNYRQAIAIKPDDSVSLYSLAKILQARGNDFEAAEFYKRGLQADPGYAAAFNNYGDLLIRLGRNSEALDAVQTAVKMEPRHPVMRNNLANLLVKLNRTDEAIQNWKAAIVSSPSYDEAYLRIGQIDLKAGKKREGIESLRRALKVKSDRPETLTTLAWVLATDPDPSIQNGAEALRLAELACNLTQNADPFALDALAAAQAGVGDFDRAIQTAKAGADQADIFRNIELARAIRDRRSLYERHQRYTSEPSVSRP